MEEEKTAQTLPRRIRGKHADSFRSYNIDTNYFHVTTRSDVS